MKRTNKIIAMVVLAVVFVSAIGLGINLNSNRAGAETYRYYDNSQNVAWVYELDSNDNAINVRISGDATDAKYGSATIATDITVPDAIDGHKVVSIGDSATSGKDSFFMGCEVEPKITVDTTQCTALTTVNQYAFYGAAYMTIELAATITNIKENAFQESLKVTAKTSNPNIIFDGEDNTGSSFKFSAPNKSAAYERYAPLNKYTDNGMTAIKIQLNKNDTKAKVGEGLFNKYIYVLTNGSNKDVSKVNIPTKDHYLFKGYYTDEKNGTMIYNENGELQTVKGLRDNDTLYAHWEAKKYTITYHADQDVTGTMEKQTVSYDSEFMFSELGFKKTGYTFVGWAKTKDGVVAYSDFTKTYQNITEEDNIDLYAVWKTNTYTVAFHANQGSGSMVNQSFTYDDDPVALTQNKFVRIGYQFAGWSVIKDGKVAYVDTEKVRNMTSTDKGTVTLYAVWKPNSYTIQFDAKGGEGTMSSVPAKYNNSIVLPHCTFTKNGYTFAGWSTSVNTNTVSYEDRHSVTSLTSEDEGKVTLYAVWRANSYTVSYNGNGATTSPDELSKSGTYDVTFNLYDENDFKKTGYRFMGWSVTENAPFTTEKEEDAIAAVDYQPGETVQNLAVSGEITLYAVWYEETYHITYDVNADTTVDFVGSYPNTYTYKSGAKLAKLSRKGYTFLGWTYNGNVITEISSNTTTGNIELVATWDVYKNPITLQGNHIKKISVNGMETAIKNGQTVTTYAYRSTISSIEFVASDFYEITGYEIVDNETGKKLFAETYAEAVDSVSKTINKTMSTKGFSVIVTTRGKTYEIEYLLNGGEIKGDYATSYIYGIGTELPTAVSKKGFTFLGFVDEKGNPVNEISKTQSGYVTLTAKWAKATYGLNIDPNGGKIEDENYKEQTSYPYDSGAISLPTKVTRSGYSFLGWYSENEKCFVTSVDTTKTEDQHIYAKWSQNSLIASEIIEVKEKGNEKEVELVKTPRTESNYYYNQLSEVEKRIYTTLYQVYGFDMNTGKCNAEDIKIVSDVELTNNDLYDASVAFVREHPETFWIRCINWGNCNFIDGKYEVVSNVLIAYTSTTSYQSDALEYKGNFDAAIKEINAGGLDSYNKLKRIHDYIITHYSYRNESKILSSDTTNETRAVGYMLAHKEGCCESYAKLTKVLCDYYGIPCVLASGNKHMWNEVQIDGKWYLYDVTWDDAENKLCYDYFLKGSKTVSDEYHQPINNFYSKLNNNGNLVPITEFGCLKAPQISTDDYTLPNTSNINNEKKSSVPVTPKTTTIGKVVYKISGKNATVVKVSSKKVKSITIQSKVKIGGKSYKVISITKNAFKNCKKLKKITIKSTYLTKIGGNAFKGISKKAKIYVPKKKYKKYKKLIAKKSTGWKKSIAIKK